MRLTRHLIAALALSLSLSLATEAQAQARAPQQPAVQQGGLGNGPKRARRQSPSFEQLDRNKDGKLVESELPRRGHKLFALADANHDKVVTKAEFDAVVAKRAQRGARRSPPRFEQLDQNKDGKLVESELPRRGHKLFARADRNNDKQVTKAEFDAVVAAKAARRGRR